MRILDVSANLRDAAEEGLKAMSRIRRRTLERIDEDAVGLLEEEKQNSQPVRQDPTAFRPLIDESRRVHIKYSLVGALVIFLVFAVISWSPRSSKSHKPDENRKYLSPNGTALDHFFHIVIPTVHNTTVCKTLLTGAVLNYPAPWVAYYNLTRQEEVADANSSVVPPTLESKDKTGSLAKLESISNLLQNFTHQEKSHTVLVLANEQSWFQLRPDVLIKRYNDLLALEQKSLSKQLSPEALAAQDIVPSVLLAATSNCTSVAGPERGCLPIAGKGEAVQYVGHDMVLGPLQEVQALYAHAVNKAKVAAQSNVIFDDHAIFADIHRQQQQHRASLRELDKLGQSVTIEESASNEFGIVLDLESRIVSGAEDITWTESGSSGKQDKRPFTFPKDIAASSPPFWTVNAALPNKPWSQVALRSNVISKNIPAIIQLPANVSADISKSWYEKLWFQNHGRVLLNSYVLTSFIPVAVLVNAEGVEHRYWSPTTSKAGVKEPNNKFRKWKTFCDTKEQAHNIFLDTVGKWKDPRP